MTAWAGGVVSWSKEQFSTNLLYPLLGAINSRGLTNQIQYVLLSMDIPYQVVEGDAVNSTTSVLFYGFKTNSSTGVPNLPPTCSLPDYSSNSFAFSELPLSRSNPNTADTNSYLAFMLTDTSLSAAEAILNRGIASDSSFPTQSVVLEKTSDSARNVRFFGFDNAITDSHLRGDFALSKISSDSTTFTNLLGLLTGFANYGLGSNSFVPGSLGDSLTSYGGSILQDSGQTSLLEFLNAGAVASYGTVVEPCNYPQKFPDPLAFYYQARGFNAAEAYYQSVLNPYQGLFVGEPLSAPFAAPGFVDWSALTNATVLSGRVTLPQANFTASGTNAPISQVDLFIDGLFFRTVTNIPPAAGTRLSLSINDSNVTYTVPAGATLPGIATAVADAINRQSNALQATAYAFGDKLELQGVNRDLPGSNMVLSVAVETATNPAVLNSYPARTHFLDTAVIGYFSPSVTNQLHAGDWLKLDVTKTNGVLVSIAVTNTTGLSNVADFCVLLMSAVNSTPELQGPDGIFANDIFPDINFAQFVLYARTAGWPAAAITLTLTASPDLTISPAGPHRLEDNLTDLRPRNHVFLAEGALQLGASLDLDTAVLADGYHELTLVGYEGTSIQTQTKITRNVLVRNSSLTATLTTSAASQVPVNESLAVSVVAQPGPIRAIELFSTGGSLGVVSNQTLALFELQLNQLGPGQHSFYAIVTAPTGLQYRTPPTVVTILPPVQVTLNSQPFELSWPSLPGATYDVLSSTNVLGPFSKLGSIMATGSLASWPLTISGAQQFYKVRAAQ